ncbi:endolytic transglycosylase MltG [Sulfurimonas sp. SAG-AH-194-I05]|nr:endolytic transglycosylase MltG [Sulfurimonas sp. SAG-AH-194-I05]MDF1875597.1 endolytic transglycosylase MltG [Sulfurimonas sp. SAG-AH-194-I05]
MKYILDMVLIIILSFMYYLNKPMQTTDIIHIPKGSINNIITQLAKQNNNVGKLDALILRVLGSPQSGWININEKTLTKADFLYKITHAKAALQNITLVPGETTYIFLNQLAKNLHLDRKKLQNAYDFYSVHKEGAFVPNTYKIPLAINEDKLIKLLLEQSLRQMKSISLKLFGLYDEKKWFQYVAIASVIQKESASIEEMPIVSSVIHNRIKKGMRLQMDGTLNYGKYSHVKVTPKRIREDRSVFNTYKHKGIPKIPVCNVSLDAIRAAIFPAKTTHLYFMKSKKGTHDFTSNYSTHLKNINRATK